MSSLRCDQRTNTVHNVINQSTAFLDIPNLRIEDRSGSALSSISGGSVHDSPTALPKWLVKALIIAMILIAVITQLLGQSVLFKITELMGFVLLFVGAFLLIAAIYYWWGMFAKDLIGINTSNVIKIYTVSCVSEVIATLSNYVVDLGLVLEASPIDIAFYFVFSLSLFSLFSSLIHRNGVASMFSQETTAYVGLTLISHYTLSSVFSDVLPSFLYSQLVYTSCLFALSISLLVVKYPKYFTLGAFRRFIRVSVTRGGGGGATLLGGVGGRRFSTVSLASSSNAPHRSSLTSQSSRGTSIVLPNHNNFDTDALNEAHGILGDLLFQESTLTQKGKESLKHIQDMLAPRVSRTAQFNSRSRMSSNVSEDESDASSIGVNPHMYGYRTSMSHKKSIRNPISQFTTTTTATGLPNVDLDPVERKRSIAPRVLKARISLAEGRPSVHQLPPNFTRDRYNSLSSPLTLSSLQTSQDSDEVDTPIDDKTRYQPVATINNSTDNPYLKLMKENGTVRRGSDGSTLSQYRVTATRSPSIDMIEENGADNGAVTETEEIFTPRAVNAPINFPSNKVSLFNPLVVPSKDYDLSDYQHNTMEVLEQVMEWDFPIFELEQVAGGHILSHMAYCLFLEAGLIDTFKIPQRQFINYFRILEANYGSNTYHNKTHAADVLHATAYLLFEEIPEFSFQISHSSEREWIGQQRNISGTSIASALSILEVFACYMGAAMHDFDHPGRTNAFLVATKNPLAVLYNDKSVLENHHAAASWDLLTSMPDNNFVSEFDEAELKRFRFLLIECILATDLKLHFDIVRAFKDKTEDDNGLDWSNDVDRLQMMKMVIKMADINTATKSYNLHRAWTVRITEEFFQQSDEEVKLALPQTIFMSRSDEDKLPSIQVSFIQNLVSPLFHTCAEAGLIPGIIESSNQPPTPSHNSEDLFTEDDDDDSIPDEAPSPVSRKIVSIILTNLEMNFEAWQNQVIIPEQEEEEKENN